MEATPPAIEPARAADDSPPSRAVRVAIAALCALAVLQGMVFAVTGDTGHRLVGWLVAALSLLVTVRPIAHGPRLVALAILGALGYANFLAHVEGMDRFPLRPLQFAIVYGYGALWLGGIGALLFRRVATPLLASALAIALCLVGFEASIDAWRTTSGVHTMGAARGQVRHLVPQQPYGPHSEARTTYFENPRGYFKQDDPRLERWSLTVRHKGSAARLVLPASAKPDTVRVEVSRAEAAAPQSVQLSYHGVGLQESNGYVIAFRIRADGPRKISYAVTELKRPRDPLGPQHELEVDTRWRDHVMPFTPKSASGDARVIFNLGASTGAVEIEDVIVRRTETGVSAIRDLPAGYSVSYRFNAHGCRGPDYAVPTPRGRQRIVVLGGSSALGVGVYEEDTFAVRLQALLNDPALKARRSASYDVINCSTGGRARHRGRLLEALGPQYRPRIVIVTVARARHALPWDGQDGNVRELGPLDRLGRLWAAARHSWQEDEKRGEPPDVLAAVQELRALKEICDRINAQLVVVAFRSQPMDGGWAPLVASVSNDFARAEVPWLDLGEKLLAEHNWRDLIVYPGADFHPNEIAHRLAAEQIAALLAQRGLLH